MIVRVCNNSLKTVSFLGKYEHDLVVSLFQKDLNKVKLIPFGNQNRISRIRREFAEFMDFGYDVTIVSTKHYMMRLRTYINFFTRNLFDCMLYTRELLDAEWQAKYFPRILFHGTTTASLPSIKRNGLLPSEAGRNFTDSIEKRVFFTDSLYTAEGYALKATESGGDLVIYRVDLWDLKKRGLRITFDPDYNVRAYDSYREFSTTEPILPRSIRNFYRYPRYFSLSPRLLGAAEYFSNQ